MNSIYPNEHKCDKITVVADQKTGPFNNKHVAATLRLLIPSIPPSELEFCNIIRLNYILRLVLHSEMYVQISQKRNNKSDIL